MDRLQFIVRELPELIRLARELGDQMLVYLLEMALVEAEDELNRRWRSARTP